MFLLYNIFTLSCDFFVKKLGEYSKSLYVAFLNVSIIMVLIIPTFRSEFPSRFISIQLEKLPLVFSVTQVWW